MNSTIFECELCDNQQFNDPSALITHYCDDHSDININDIITNSHIRILLGLKGESSIPEIPKLKCDACGAMLEAGNEYDDHKYSHELQTEIDSLHMREESINPIHESERKYEEAQSPNEENILTVSNLGSSTLFNLFTRDQRFRRGHPNNEGEMSYEQMLELDENVKNGIENKYLSYLKENVMDVKTITKLNQVEKKCMICLEDIGIGDEYIRLPCLHIFHQKDLLEWFSTSKFCPVCKLNIQEELKKIE